MRRYALDTYYPEVGRYGGGECMHAAEAVFAADSAVATAQLRRPPGIDPVALAALGMLDIAAAFSGGLEQGAQWLAGRRLPPGKAADRATARTATMLARNGELSSFGTLPADLAPAWRQRYRGIDRDSEGTCRRLARQAALARTACLPETA